MDDLVAFALVAPPLALHCHRPQDSLLKEGRVISLDGVCEDQLHGAGADYTGGAFADTGLDSCLLIILNYPYHVVVVVLDALIFRSP
jgi:hypothetical protein